MWTHLGRLALALSLLAPGAAAAGGFHVTVVGVRRTAMMANLGAPDDATALYVNPAGLADQPGVRLFAAAGLTFLSTELRLQALDARRFPEINPGCGDPSADPTCPWPVDPDGAYRQAITPERAFGVVPFLAASTDLGFLDLDDVVVSLAVYAPGAYGADLPRDAPTAYSAVEGLFVIGAVTAGFGVELTPWLSVGANVSYNYRRLSFAQKFSLVDALTAAGVAPAVDGDPLPELAQGLLGDLLLEYHGEDHGFGAALGVLVRPTSFLSLGLSFTAFSSATFDGGTTIAGLGSRAVGTGPTSPAELRQIVRDFGYKLPSRLTVEMPIPPAILAGAAVALGPRVELGVDLRLWLYSLFERQLITPGYDPGEPGREPFDAARLSRDKDYAESWELSAGVLVRPLDDLGALELMAGLAFDKSPVPDRTFSIDNPSLDVLTLATGLRVAVSADVRLGASYMFLVHLPRAIEDSGNSPPTNGRVSATSHLPTVEVTVRL